MIQALDFSWIRWSALSDFLLLSLIFSRWRFFENLRECLGFISKQATTLVFFLRELSPWRVGSPIHLPSPLVYFWFFSAASEQPTCSHPKLFRTPLPINPPWRLLFCLNILLLPQKFLPPRTPSLLRADATIFLSLPRYRSYRGRFVPARSFFPTPPNPSPPVLHRFYRVTPPAHSRIFLAGFPPLLSSTHCLLLVLSHNFFRVLSLPPPLSSFPLSRNTRIHLGHD